MGQNQVIASPNFSQFFTRSDDTLNDDTSGLIVAVDSSNSAAGLGGCYIPIVEKFYNPVLTP